MRRFIAVALLLCAVTAFAQDKAEKAPDTNALAQFLVKAKTEGYASGDPSRIRKLGDGGLEVTFAEAECTYRDRWYGERSFTGEEIVQCNGKPAWSMNYYGATAKDQPIPAEFPSFHKSALRRVTLAAPFRGPVFYQDGDFVYVNEFTGSIREFSGVERVLYRGKEIFRLVYHGGLLEK